ncbi:DUF397 domain-containing protein [Streptomyces sp. URMC 126]|uniref:DUF397 domain-containing protein n=1 Tax=Streptomyces sp. URMC 126 TaxID=3423401 RepID=UPI003F1E0FDF
MTSSPESPGANWVKSSYSSGEGGMCLEWAPERAPTGLVPIRDSKRTREGRTLTFPTAAWHAFVSGLKHAGQGSR